MKSLMLRWLIGVYGPLVGALLGCWRPHEGPPSDRSVVSVPAAKLAELTPSKYPKNLPLGPRDPVPMVDWRRHDGRTERAHELGEAPLLLDFYPLPSSSAVRSLQRLKLRYPELREAGVRVRAFAALSPDRLAEVVATSSLPFALATASPPVVSALSVATDQGRPMRNAFLFMDGRVARVWRVGLGEYIDEVVQAVTSPDSGAIQHSR